MYDPHTIQVFMLLPADVSCQVPSAHSCFAYPDELKWTTGAVMVGHGARYRVAFDHAALMLAGGPSDSVSAGLALACATVGRSPHRSR